MKKYVFFLMAFFVPPAYSDTGIAAGADSADCNVDVLGTMSGTVNLRADWTANTIQLRWYNDDELLNVQTDAQTCTYGGAIILPTTIPTKVGYTFDRWRVRWPFDLLSLDTDIDGLESYARMSRNNTDYCFEYDDGYGENICITHADSLNGVAVNQWKTVFDYGTVYGTAYCSALGANNNNYRYNNDKTNWSASESELSSAVGEARKCWCKIIGFDKENDGSFVAVNSPLWVFGNDDISSESDCISNCAGHCAKGFKHSNRSGGAFRAALYSASQ